MTANTITEAPAIKINGVKATPNKSKLIIDNDLIAALADLSGGEFKLMIYYLGNAEGWRTSTADVLKRTGMSKPTYINSRKKLIERGYVTLTPHDTIEVNVDKFYAAAGAPEQNEVQQKEKEFKF